MKNVFLTVLCMSLAGGITTLIVLVLRRVLRRAPKWAALILWGIVGLRLMLPFFPESSLSLMPKETSVKLDPVSQEIVLPATVSELIPRESVPAAAYAPVTPVSPSASSAPAAPIKAGTDWLGIASYAWAGGVCAMLLYAAISYCLLRRRLRTAVRSEGNVYESEAAKTPFLLGLFRPRIYVPFGLEGVQRESVLAHERAHIAHLDHLLKPLGFLLLCVHWFDPLAWAAYVFFSKDIELACDERVIRKLGEDARADYSQTLLDLSKRQRLISVCPLAFGSSNAKERVKNVFSYKKPAFWIMILAVLAIGATAVCFLTRPKTGEPTEDQPVLYSPETAVEYAKENGFAAVIDNEFKAGEDIWNAFVHSVNEGGPAGVTVLVNGPAAILTSSQGDIEAGIVTAHAIAYDGEGFTVKSATLTSKGLENEWSAELRYACLDRYTVNMNGGQYGQYALMDEALDDTSRVVSEPVTRGGNAVTSSSLPEERPAVYPLFTYAFPSYAAEAPRPLTGEEKVTVSRAYRALFDYEPGVLNSDEGGVYKLYSGLVCLGVFGDTAVLFEAGPLQALSCRMIGENRFCFSSSFGLYACRGETLVSLERAYAQGWITDGQVGTARELYKGLVKTDWGEDDNPLLLPPFDDPSEAIDETEAVIFDEPLIARAVRNSLNISTGVKIKASYLSRVTNLELTGIDLGSLEDLERLHYIKSLSIWDAPNADFDSIPVYTKLGELSVRNCGLTDISFVSKFTGVEHLDLSDNYIEDVSPLRALPNLKLLNIENNRISSIEGLMKLPALSDIEFSWNPLTDAQADELIEHVMSNGDPDFGPTANFYTGDKSRFACWPVDLDEDGVDEYFYANLDWMAIDFVSYVWLEDASGRRLGDWLPCGTGHVAFGTYALVNDETNGACIMRIAPEFLNEYYGYDLYDLRDGKFQHVRGEVFYNYDALEEEQDDEAMEDFLDPVYAKAYEERMRELLDSGYVLVTTDRWGVMMRELYLKDSGKPLDRPSGTMAIICTEGASVDPARRAQYETMGLTFVDEPLGYRFMAEPFRGEND